MMPPCSLVVVATVWRHLDNLLPALETIRAAGGRFALVAAAYPGDAGAAALLAIPADSLRIVRCRGSSIPEFQCSFPMPEVVAATLAAVAEVSAQLILLPNNFYYPQSAFRRALREAGCTLPVVAAQHGVLQPWSSAVLSGPSCDWFLCLGDAFLEPARPTAVRGVVATGMPKLDRLAGLRREPRHIVLFSDPVHGRAEMELQDLVDSLPERAGFPLYVRGHPMYPLNTGLAHVPQVIDQARMTSVNEMPIVLATTALALGMHSTTLLEAMCAGVPTVVLPLHAWRESYPDWPGCAEAVTAEAVMQARMRLLAMPEAAQRALGRLVAYRPGEIARAFAGTLIDIAMDRAADTRAHSR